MCCCSVLLRNVISKFGENCSIAVRRRFVQFPRPIKTLRLPSKLQAIVLYAIGFTRAPSFHDQLEQVMEDKAPALHESYTG